MISRRRVAPSPARVIVTEESSMSIHPRIRPLLIAAASLLVAVAPAAAQPGPGEQPGLQELQETEQRPLELLMRVRDELQLTDPQVARLREIAGRLEEANRPLRRQLVMEYGRWREQRRGELLRMTPAERRAELSRANAAGRPPVPPPLRPLVARIHGNIRGAMREAASVLTPAQRARAREMIGERRGGRMGGGQGLRRGRMGGRRFPPARGP
jgi:Spy/CpxP family protein refolding chaperone